MNRWTFAYLLFLLFNQAYSQINPWNKSIDKNLASINNEEFYNLDFLSFENEIENNTNNYIELQLPANKTEFVVFKLQKLTSFVGEFSEISSYKGNSKNKKYTTFFTYTKSKGISGYMKNNHLKKSIQISYLKNGIHKFKTKTQLNAPNYSCATHFKKNNYFSKTRVPKAYGSSITSSSKPIRIYRLALAVTGEYSRYFLDGTETSEHEKKTKVLAAMLNSVNRINDIYTRELGIKFELPANNEQLVFLNPSTDPFNTGAGLGNELQKTVDDIIGSSNFDIAHLLHKDDRAYGNSGCIGCVCNDNSKGKGYTAHSDPSSDNINLIIAHEIGHQFGAYHTQSSDHCRSGFNSEVEPGSGSTIMSYAGICSPNIQNEPDDYFNYTSIRDINYFVENEAFCSQQIPTGNEQPVIDLGQTYVIPKNTPFVLEASANDSSSDDLTYCWEQNNPENPFIITTPLPDQEVGPLFRSLPPITTPKRYFPSLNSLSTKGGTNSWEVLPTISRDLNFVCTVRDNNLEVGLTNSSGIQVQIDDTSIPFSITSQNSTQIWNVGEPVTITWDVGNTNTSPIETNEIEIWFSYDEGLSFPELLAITENDGTHTFNLPNINTTSKGRVLLKAVDNIFFSVNQDNIVLQKSEFGITATESTIAACISNTVSFQLNYFTVSDFDENVTLSLQNIPSLVTATLSKNTFDGKIIGGQNFTIDLQDTNKLVAGTYEFQLVGTSISGIQKTINLSFTLLSASKTNAILAFPVNNSEALPLNILLEWNKDTNAQSYILEVATNNSFTTSNIILNEETQLQTKQLKNLIPNQQYYWRVTSKNDCGFLGTSEIYSFSTKCSEVSNFRLTNSSLSEIEFEWDSDINNTFEIEYGLLGFSMGEGQTSTATESIFKFTALESSTAYDFYITPKCSSGVNGDIFGPITYTTKGDYCNGDLFFDSGGENHNYSKNENTTTIIKPEQIGEHIIVTFNSFDLEANYDFLSIYNGENTNQLIGKYTSNDLLNKTIQSTDDTGALTFVFTSDNLTNTSGWEASVECKPKPYCFNPKDISISQITTQEAFVEWSDIKNTKSWIIEYGKKGFNRGTGTVINSSTNHLKIDNLTPSTTYEVYVTSICNNNTNDEDKTPDIFTTSADVCGEGWFYDSGGALNNYTNGESKTTTIYPSNDTNKVSVEFISFELELNQDYLKIYNGNSSSDELIGIYSGSGKNLIDTLITSTHASGALTFEFTSDAISNLAGWEAKVYCNGLPNCQAPSNLSVDALSDTFAKLTWDINDTSTWQFQYINTEDSSDTKTFTTSENTISLEALNAFTTYQIKLSSLCNNGVLNHYNEDFYITTLCKSTPNNFITNGDFNCETSSWQISDEIDSNNNCSDGIDINNHLEKCLLETDFNFSDNYKGIFRHHSFHSKKYTLNQTIKLPETVAKNEVLSLSYEFDFEYFFPSLTEGYFQTSIITNDNDKIIIYQNNFTKNKETQVTNKSFKFDFIDELKDHLGKYVTINFDLFLHIPENQAGSFLGILDNISLKKQPIDHLNNPSIIISPNPNDGKFIINSSEDFNKVTLYDISGKLIHSISALNTKELELNLVFLNSGIYFVKVDSNRFSKTEKMILR